MAMAWDGFDPDTRESLRGARSEARESFYGTSYPKILVGTAIIILSLTTAILGLAVEEPLRFVLVLGGISGLEVAAVWLTYRS